MRTIAVVIVVVLACVRVSMYTGSVQSKESSVTYLSTPLAMTTQDSDQSLAAEFILTSTLYPPLDVVANTSSTSPILVLCPFTPFGCEANSSRGRVYSRLGPVMPRPSSAVLSQRIALNQQSS